MTRPFLLVLSFCSCALPDRVIGVWDRIYSDGVAIPAGAVDRLTATQTGRITLERDGHVERGTWAEDLSSQVVTLVLDGATTTWRASRPQCPDGLGECIVLTDSAGADWYRFDWPAYGQP